ncbi:hypothetical protein B5S32_g3391 [[Candida] boidinii]|nr:hypothetical protein B5S32_g3391 [[Candida] boidinii]
MPTTATPSTATLVKSILNSMEEEKNKENINIDGNQNYENVNKETRYYRPFLNLKERLSQIWMNYYTISIVLIILKLLMLYKSLNNSLINSKETTIEVCTNIETLLDKFLNNFNKLAIKTSNYLIIQTINTTYKLVLDSFELTLIIAEALILFMIDTTIGTYLCLIVSAIDSTVEVATNATMAVIGVANDTMIEFAQDLQGSLNIVSKVVNSLIDAANSIKNFFTGGNSDNENNVNSGIKNINLKISSLQNWKIDSSINEKLTNLSSETPDFDDVQEELENFISIPFSLIKENISSRKNKTYTVQDLQSYFSKETNNRNQNNTLGFCNENTIELVDEFYNHALQLLKKTMKVLIICILICLVISLIFEILVTVKNWRHLNKISDMIILENKDIDDKYDNFNYNSETNNYNNNEEKYNNMQNIKSKKIINMIELSKYRYKLFFQEILNKLSTKDPQTLQISNSVKINKFNWFVSYNFSTVPSTILLFGILGVVCFIFQYIIIVNLQNLKFDEVSNSSLAQGSKAIIEENLNKTLTTWSIDTNDYISLLEDDMNTDFLEWTHNSTGTLNETVTKYMDEMDAKIDAIFKDTPLYDPIKIVVGCTIERKLVKIQKGLTFINEKSQIELPRVNSTALYDSLTSEDDKDDYYDYEVEDINYTETSKRSIDIDNELDSFQEEMKKIYYQTIEVYKRSIFLELWISLGVLTLWLINFFIGLLIFIIKESKYKNNKLKNPLGNSSYLLPSTLLNNEKFESKENLFKNYTYGDIYKSQTSQDSIFDYQGMREKNVNEEAKATPMRMNEALNMMLHNMLRTPKKTESPVSTNDKVRGKKDKLPVTPEDQIGTNFQIPDIKITPYNESIKNKFNDSNFYPQVSSSDDSVSSYDDPTSSRALRWNP